jgi:hypothetical protein
LAVFSASYKKNVEALRQIFLSILASGNRVNPPAPFLSVPGTRILAPRLAFPLWDKAETGPSRLEPDAAKTHCSCNPQRMQHLAQPKLVR